MLLLSAAANKFSSRPSALYGIDDAEIALAFDLECTDIFHEWELEQKAIELQAIVTGQIAKQFEGAAKQIPEITQANFGDRTF